MINSIMVKAELEQACELASSIDEMLQAFKELELNAVSETVFGMECANLAYEFHAQGQDPEKILCLGKRGLKTLIEIGKNPTTASNKAKFGFCMARLLQLLGCVCMGLRKFNESVSYFNWAVRNLVPLLEDDEEGSVISSSDVVVDMLSDLHCELSRVKTVIGRRDEGMENLRKALEYKEMGKGGGNLEVGAGYQEVADRYLKCGRFEEAVSFYLKAEEIYVKHCIRPDSALLVYVRRQLALVYFELEEYEKALEVNELSLSVLRRDDCSFELIDAELLAGQVMVELGRCDEAVECLKGTVSHAEMMGAEGVRASAFLWIAKACCVQKKFSEAKKYIRIALRIVEKKNVDCSDVVTLLNQMSILYEEMEEYEIAISLLRRLLAISDLPQDDLIEYSQRIFVMVCLSGDEKQMMRLEGVIERLKRKLGPSHFHVGHGYLRMGDCYLHFGRPDMAVKFLALAKGVMDVSLSPHQPDSVQLGHDLAIVYSAMGSYSLAMECEEKVVKVLEGLGPDYQDSLDKAVEVLNDIKNAWKEKETLQDCSSS